MQPNGIVRNEIAGDAREVMWGAIIVDPLTKSRLVNWAVLALHLRVVLPSVETALAGLALLHGPPGTGKTSLARGLAGPLRQLLHADVRVLDVDAHALMSGEHGQSQRSCAQLLLETIPSLSRDENPTVVILDEVESLAVSRSAASLAANPVDVHRTTDAAVAAVDALADSCPNVIVVATTNFPVAVDEALRSRADIVVEIPLPDLTAIDSILRATLAAYARAFPNLKKVAEDEAITQVAALLDGRDARQVRKFVADTLAADTRTAAAPETLTVAHLLEHAARIR